MLSRDMKKSFNNFASKYYQKIEEFWKIEQMGISSKRAKA